MIFIIRSSFTNNLAALTYILLADALYMKRLKPARLFWLRLGIALGTLVGVCYCFSDLLPQGVAAINGKYAVFLILSILFTRFCFDINWNTTLFCSTAGYITQHITTTCFYMLQKGGLMPYNFPVNLCAALAVYSLFYLCFARHLLPKRNVQIKNRKLIMLVLVVLLTQIILNTTLIGKLAAGFDPQYDLVASVLNIICSFCTIIILFGQQMRKDLEDELTIINQMWHEEQKQFRISKETIDAINRKGHDLRHQIRVLGDQKRVDKDVLSDIAESIRVYDAMVKTGNEALDIILAEKSIYCSAHNISIHYIADGAKLNFMRDSDIYSLFGNMLDNAIFSVMNLEDEKRYISLTIRAEGNLLSINTNNYYIGEIKIVDGYPQTSNDDKSMHGYGVRSMDVLVSKYDGSFAFDTRDSIFNLNILIPIPSK